MEEELKLLGLNDIDIRVFLTMLELGESPASEIAQKSKIPRASIYDILERLEKEGLANHTIKEFKKYFSATEPRLIIKNLEHTKQKITSILPELEKIKKSAPEEKTKTEIYEGKKGIQAILNLMLEEKELFVIGASRKTQEVLPYFIDSWHKERTKRKIKVKIIYNDIPELKKELQKPEIKKVLGAQTNWDYKFLHTDYLSPVMTIVFGNKVVLINWVKNPSAILIQNKDISETYKQYMLNLWRIAKK
jgi:sugar-specific transcriptional regulator TrmB